MESATRGAGDCFAGGGDMGALMRAFDWSTTPLGPVDRWPQSLRTAVSIMLASGFPMLVLWGDDYIQLYNDAYRPVLGATKHPAALGQRARDCWPEIWDDVLQPMFGSVMAGGAPIWNEDLLFVLDRNGYLEETYFTFSYSAIRDESGRPGGVLVTCVETTERVLGERRLRTLRELASHSTSSLTVDDACGAVARTLAANPNDLPFAALYLSSDGGSASCSTTIGLSPASGDTDSTGNSSPWPLADVIGRAEAQVVTGLRAVMPGLPGGPWPEPADTAIVLPIASSGQAPAFGALVAGISPRRALDGNYRGFLDLVAGQIATAITAARAYEAERERAEALAQIDREKTAFFSNVSHEFRTPLTLMLGPVESLLSETNGPLTDAQRAEVEILRRNAGRLLKLVNALLDFSRIEAGRTTASYRPTDVAEFTRELAGAFRSAIEHAGIRFDVDCERIDAPVYVDRDMWEKIVLNLLSNALKFTFRGAIRVSLRDAGDRVQLVVQDTGTGIPEPELPRIFERFHRVEGARSRTHEGTGIGLALTHELVRLHGGTIAAESRVDEGTRFVVTIPTGRAHLPADQIDEASDAGRTLNGAAPFIAEAARWLPDAPFGAANPAADAGTMTADDDRRATNERILVVDDNADMRDYLRQLLRGWEVTTAADGATALEMASASPPGLIVSDVMMPGLDGFELLRRLRQNPRTAAVPVLMLSARAGEEARVSGLDAGADDYIVKPFGARELVARVGSLLKLARARREAELQKQHLRSLFMQAPTPIVMLRGADHVIELANPMTCLVWGRTEGEVAGKPLLDALPELRDQPFRTLLDGVLRTGVPYVGKEMPARIGLGGDSLRTTYFNFVYAPLRGVDDEIEGILVIAFDVTDEVVARNEMNRLRALAEEASATKDQFLAMLGHELRNPLAPILTALQLMTLRGDDTALKERAVIDRQVRHLVRLVDDLLDVSRIARGKVELRHERIEIAEVVASAIETISPLLEHREHELVVDVPRGLAVRGDAIRLTQILMNVIGNAAKYTDSGGRIRVSARRDGGDVEIRVKDSGVGIAPEMLPHVFDTFVQARQSTDRALGGLGLGLSIAKSLTELHGGTIRAESAGLGAGSEFVLRLPLAVSASEGAADAQRAPARVSVPRTGRRVLVVDDNGDAARLMADALEVVGHEARTAVDGPAALRVAAEFRPHAALLDLGLPVMDGYELAARLAEVVEPRPVLIAVTGYGQESDQARTRAAGFHAHVVKPVDVSQLLDLLGTLLGAGTAR